MKVFRVGSGYALIASVAVASPAIAKPKASPQPVPITNPVSGAFVLSNLSWTNKCSTTGAGGQFFPTCASAELNLYDNQWLELRFWNRAGFGATFADAAVKAIGFGGLAAPTGTRGAANGWDAGFGGFQIGWQPEADIQGPNDGNGFKTSGNPDAFCSGLGVSCPGGITTPWTSNGGGGFASFYWYAGAGVTSLDPNVVSLQMHAGSGPNGWSTGYLCLSDGASTTVVDNQIVWACGEDGTTTTTSTEIAPEPATMTLLGTGLAAMMAARRRRRAQR